MIASVIEAIPESLLLEQDKALRNWLKKSECATLIRVVDSKVKLAEVEAHKDAHKAMTDKLESFDLMANANMRQAHKYQTFLDVLAEVMNQPPDEPHQIVKLK